MRDDDGQDEERHRELVEERQAREDTGGLQRRSLQQRVQAEGHEAHHHAGALGQEGCRGQRARESGGRPEEVTGRKTMRLKGKHFLRAYDSLITLTRFKSQAYFFEDSPPHLLYANHIILTIINNSN